MRWVPPTGTLGELTERAWVRSQTLGVGADRDRIAASRSNTPSFRQALRRDHLAIIAEIKRSSPTKGEINPGIDSGQQAVKYADGGAAAISVLTEALRFGGSDDDVDQVRRAVSLPVLKKDFHVSEAQLIHAAETGSAAALVIVRAIEPSRLRGLIATARSLALELLLEVRDEAELVRALNAGGEVIGVNNRNLETLEIDRDTVSRILPLVPSDCIAVAESGYSTVDTVAEAADAGADAVLVGSSLSAATDPSGAVRRLTGIARHSRSGKSG